MDEAIPAAGGNLRLGRRVMDRLDALAAYTSEAPALTRLYLTPEHAAAAARVRGWMDEAGLATKIDAAGNVVGRKAGAQADAPILILGSHIDTVRDGGLYDGNLGVVAAIEAVAALDAPLPFAIEVIAFGDEEGVRFPVTLTGSRAVAGTLDAAHFEAADRDGMSLGAALAAFGGDPVAARAIGRDPRRVAAYVEIHIEQGPVLEAEGLPVGIVTAIAGATRLEVAVTGMAGHAGTVPMALRRDSGAAAAEMVLAVEAVARERSEIVATVGRIEFGPGAVNVVPGRAVFTIDLRSPDDTRRAAALEDLGRRIAAIAAQRGVAVETRVFYSEAAAPCHPALIAALSGAVERIGVRPLRLVSGAGHDGLAMIALCPIGMVFVRCAGGISHNPAEAIEVEDADAAVRVLIEFLRAFDPALLRPAPPAGEAGDASRLRK